MRKLLATMPRALPVLSVICLMVVCSTKEEPAEPNNNTPNENTKFEVSGVSWATSDSGVATVSNGKVTAKKEGAETRASAAPTRARKSAPPVHTGRTWREATQTL